jgi:two-component system nitrate/nitrite response regulator NarL
MSENIRIVIVDDHPLFREGVAHTLNNALGLEIVGQAEDSESAIDLVSDKLPDVVLLDVTMPKGGGIAAAKKISTLFPVIKIIMLTGSEDEDNLLNSLKAGAHGYIIKGVHADELASAVRSVYAGDAFISQSIATSLLLEISDTPKPDPLSTLTERETQILELVSKGLTNKEIGKTLFLAEKTIKHYMTNVLQKLHVRSRVEAALLAQKHNK